MSVDLSRFHGVFFEESYEAVNTIETGFLDIDVDNVDPEEINTIFRAAHSIKGGSATFGFTQVAEFTHVMENLLDQIREGKRGLNQDIVDVLLGSVDGLRAMLASAKSNEQLDQEEFAAFIGPLDALLDSNDGPKPTPTVSVTAAETDPSGVTPEVSEDEAAANGETPVGWRIVFTPHKEMMQRGNDPLRLIRELAELGPCEVESDASLIPEWEHFEPLNSYISWTIRLNKYAPRTSIEEIFSWVEDECDLAIVPVLPEVSAPEAAASNDAAAESVMRGQQNVATPVPAGRTEAENSSPAEASPSPAEKVTKAKPKASSAPAESQSIRVDLLKVDSLINMVGELVITQSMLNMLSEDEDLQGNERLQQGLLQLHRQTRALQEGVMQIRMLPISFCFNRFPRMVRDLSRQLSKDIELVMSGENTEVDKTVIEKITDPLVHLVRNSVDHGIETLDERRAAGKSENGTVYLRAYHQVGNIIIEVEDDGKGMDPDALTAKAKRKGLITEDAILTDAQALDLVFLPGFSTKEEASDLSGRGVGMDVVKRNVQALGGSIVLESELGQGTRFTIRLPLTLAIMDGQLVAIEDEVYVVPLVSIIESLQPYQDMVNKVVGLQETIKLRGQYLPVLRLAEALQAPGADYQKPLTEGIVVVVEHENRRFGLFVDDLLSQQQIVIKTLDDNYRPVPGVSGATILGDGRVALILDVGGLAQLQNQADMNYADAG